MNQATQIICPLTVNFDRSVEGLVKEGDYFKANHHKLSPITTEEFPPLEKGVKKIKVIVFSFGKDISFNEALLGFQEMKFRHCSTHEFLTLGIEYPDLQREFPIVDLSSFRACHGGGNEVLVLETDQQSRRILHRVWFGIRWGAKYHFLAIPQST